MLLAKRTSKFIDSKFSNSMAIAESGIPNKDRSSNFTEVGFVLIAMIAMISMIPE